MDPPSTATDDNGRDAATDSVSRGQIANDATEDGLCRALQDVCAAMEEDGLCRALQDVCAAMERGDAPGALSLLGASGGEGESSSSPEPLSPESNAAALRPGDLLSVFLHSIGHTAREGGGAKVPSSAKAHLMLRAALRLPVGKYSTPWEAAVATVEIFQYSMSHGGAPNSPSFGRAHSREGMAMIAEIRSFVTHLRTRNMKETNASNAIKRLSELGNAILEPLRVTSEIHSCPDRAADLEGRKAQRSRRTNSYLLPLELIPAILATLDVLCDRIEFENRSMNDGDAAAVPEDGKEKCEGTGAGCIRPSNELLSSLFVSRVKGDCNGFSRESLRRSMRADSALPVLSLAIDDIGPSRMSAVLSTEDGLSHWDCLRLALSDVVGANLMCCYGENASVRGMAQGATRKILEEAASEKGVHVIPLSDYPAMIRCAFRMVAASPSGGGWISLLLQLYHAAAIATSKLASSSLHRAVPGEVDRLATFSTVEVHVLLPSLTGSASSTIKSILEACVRECCPSCKECARKEKLCDVAAVAGFTFDSNDIPTWAIARIVLLIMRARASDQSHLATAGNFGPRAVFRMAADVMRRATKEDKAERGPCSEGLGSNDEVGHALDALLHLSGAKGKTCRDCLDGIGAGSDKKQAQDALRCSYYADNDQFVHRYSRPKACDSPPHRHKLGLQILSSYSNLVCATLNHGAAHGTGKVTDSFAMETSQAWIDVANMLLDEYYLSPAHQNTSFAAQYGTSMAIVIIVVIFFQVPLSQESIVRRICDRVENMTSRNLCDGRRGEESCFMLISVLAWSLGVREHRKGQSFHARRGGKSQQGHDATSVLRPLCSLLSKSVLHQQPHAALDHNNGRVLCLSYRVLCQLGSSGREAVLAMAQKSMSFLSASSLVSHSSSKDMPSFESLPCSPSAANNAIYSAIDSLCVLIEKYPSSNSSSMDDCGETATRMITNIIVLKHPSPPPCLQARSCVPIKVIKWMLCKLNKSALMGKLTQWASQRILRACSASLLEAIAFEQTEMGVLSATENEVSMDPLLVSSHGTKEKPNGVTSPVRSITLHVKNNTPEMLRLVASLYDQITNLEENENSCAAQSHRLLKAYLLNTLLGDVLEKDSTNRLLKEGYDALRRGFDPTDKQMGCIVDGVLLVIVYRGAARIIREKRHSVERSNKMTSNGMIKCIHHAEKYFYTRNRDIGTVDPCVPSWLELQGQYVDARKEYQGPTMQIDEALQNSPKFKLVHMAMCDILIETLLSNWICQDGVEVDQAPCEMSIILGVIFILGSKRAANELSVNGTLLLGDTSVINLSKLVELSSHHLRFLLSNSKNKKDAFAYANEVIVNALDSCKAMRSNPNIQGTPNPRLILSSLSSLYHSIADDESSQLLSSFIKEYYIDIGRWADPEDGYDISETSFSLLFITSSEDLDFHVRHLRESILSALSHVLKTLSTSENESSFEERKACLDLLFQLMPALCQDLDLGFQGYSGGITKRLILFFFESIDKSVDAMSALFESIPTHDQCQISSSYISVHKASLLIWGMFTDNPLQQASIIKGALRLCIEKMPMMIQRVERVCRECIVMTPLYEEVCKVLDLCSFSLKFNGKIVPESKENEVLEPPKSGCANASSPVLEPACGNGQARITPKQNCQADPTKRREDSSKRNESKAQMPHNISNAESLHWAYICAFATVTNIWNESYRIIKGIDCRTKRNRATFTGEKTSSLALRRVGEFHSLHTSVCRVFEREGNESNGYCGDTESRKSTKILAELLTHSGKSQLSSCIEKMAMTLTLCTKQVVKYVESFTPVAIDNEIKLHESVVCLSGWLLSRKANETHFDLITGPLQWYINEKRHFNPSSLEKKSSESYPILGRLPKILLRLERLEAEMRKLNDFVNGPRLRETGKLSEKVAVLNQIVSGILCIYATAKEKEDRKNEIQFRDLLQQCLELVDSRKQEMNQINGNMMSDEDESESDMGGNSDSWGRKRKLRYASTRRYRRTSLRSRNVTIDNWLAMDDNDIRSTPGEKRNVDDAFVDLEDFLVEG